MQIDCGNARAGVWWEDDEAVEIVKYLQSQGNVKFQGTDLCGFFTVKVRINLEKYVKMLSPSLVVGGLN